MILIEIAVESLVAAQAAAVGGADRIELCAELHAAGGLTPSKELTRNVLGDVHNLVAAGGLPFTFHRAFDRVSDQSIALEQLVDLGVTRVLTSGGAATALDGRARLRALVEQSAGRIAILAGGGVRESNVKQVVSLTGVSEVHTKLTDTADEALTAERVGRFCEMAAS